MAAKTFRPLITRQCLFSIALLLTFSLLAAAPALAVFGDDNNTETQPTEGTIAAINVQGNTRTDTALVYRVMGMQVGGPFTLDQLDNAWDALEDCGYFRFVEIDYNDDDPANVVLDVSVEEDMTTFYGPLVRYSRRHKYELGGWAEQRNLRGRGEVLRLEVAALYLQRGRVSWQRPWLFGVDGLETTVAVDGEAADFVYRPFRYHKWDTVWELRWNFCGHFFMGSDIQYGYFQQRDDYAVDLPDRGGDGPSGPAFYGAGDENHWGFGATVGFDSRENPYYPRHGLLAQTTVRNWQSNGFDSYTESLADVRAFVPLPWRHHILALHGWGRQVTGPTNIDNALYFGGPETVRGYQYASREGENGYLFSVEYRIPLFLMPISPKGEMVGFGFHFFGDAGDAWYDGAEAGVAQMSYGAGSHFNLDTWQLRFEAARTKDGVWQFEFMDKFNF